MKTFIQIVFFQIGVTVIGLPDFYRVNLSYNQYDISNKKSKFHK